MAAGGDAGRLISPARRNTCARRAARGAIPLKQRLRQLRHGIGAEAHIIGARTPQRAGEMGNPGKGPVAGDLGAAGMVVGVNERDAHERPSGVGRSMRRAASCALM